MLKIATRGEIIRESGIDGVVVERDKTEILKTAEKRRKRAANVGVGEVDRGNRHVT